MIYLVHAQFLIIIFLIYRFYGIRKEAQFYLDQWNKFENEYWWIRSFPENKHRSPSWLPRGFQE